MTGVEERMMELAAAMGRIREEDRPVLALLCAQARRELAGQLRPGVSEAGCEDAMALAGAWMALAGLYAGDGDVARFAAGDLSVQYRDGAARGAALRLQARQIMRPFVADSGFAFRGVAG